MYPPYDKNESCTYLCADCYWEEDSRRKYERRKALHADPEKLEAYRKHVCEVLGLNYEATKEQNKIEANKG